MISSFCNWGECVDVKFTEDGRVVVSGIGQGAVLVFTPEEWIAFTRGVKAGEFDLHLICDRTHRFPQGPNEDIGVCACGRMAFKMRPQDETFGYHLSDCSLPRHHESFCKPGGDGHPKARVIRG